MKLDCENCGGAFRVEDAAITAEGVTVLCPHCSFPHRLEIASAAPPSKRPASFAEEDTESLFYTGTADAPIEEPKGDDGDGSGIELIDLLEQTGAQSEVSYTAQERIIQSPKARAAFTGERDALEREKKAAQESGAKLLHLMFFIALGILIYAYRNEIMNYMDRLLGG